MHLDICKQCEYYSEVSSEPICKYKANEPYANFILCNCQIATFNKCPLDKWSKSFLSKAKEFVSTVTSGFCDDNTYTQRLNSCNTCLQVEREGDKFYCKACGCPNWKLAELSVKLHFATLTCPLRRPGFYRSPDMKEEARKILNPELVKQMIHYAKLLIDKNLVPLSNQAASDPAPITNFNTAHADFKLVNEITPAQLSAANQRMTEALHLENWTEGFMFAIQIILLATK